MSELGWVAKTPEINPEIKGFLFQTLYLKELLINQFVVAHNGLFAL